jgi:Sec-independent protein translocase protein TatA
MNEGNAILVVLVVIGMIIFANGLMFLAARGLTRGNKTTRKFLNSSRETFSQPFQKEDKSIEELRKRVEELARKK